MTQSLRVEEARARADLLRIDSYAVDLDLTRGDDVFGSVSTIRFAATDTSGATFVDVAPRKLARATLNGTELDVDSWVDGRLPLPHLEAANELVIEAEMAYSHDGEGLHRSVDAADGKTYVYAMTFLDAAPRVFGCFDQPDLKAPYDVSVTAPLGWRVVGNGVATEQEPGHWRLATTQPLSTYFATIVAGPYHCVEDTHDGIPLGLHVKASLAAHLDKDAEELFRLTGQSFDAYHRLFGIRYPFGAYHQAFVPEFNAGAMENPGCVTFRDDLVFRSRVTDGERGMRARTVVHEMAHQWFGDLVTMRWWDDLWLNESFAEYMAYRVTDSDTDFRDSWVDFAYVRKRWGMVADQRPSTHPVAGNGAADAASALSDFDGISYAKGAAALKQLNAYLGDEVFLGGVRAHLREYAYGNATLADLLAAWTKAGATNLTEWATQWLGTPGIDTLRVERSGERAMLRRTAPEQFPANRPHRFAVIAYGTRGAGGSAEVVVVDELTPLPAQVASSTEHPVVVADTGDDTWAKVRLDPDSIAALPTVLPLIEDPVARAAVWNSLRDALNDAEHDPGDYLHLMAAALPAEDEDIAVSSLLGGAHRLLGRYLPVQHYASRLADVARACLDAAPADTARQVAAARGFVSATADAERLQGWLTGAGVPAGLSVDTEMRWSIELRLAILGAADEKHIAAELAVDQSAEGEIHAMRCRAARPDTGAKAAAWHAITTDARLSNYELYALCEGFWQPEQSELTEPYVARYFREVPATASIRSGWLAQSAALLSFPVFAVEPSTLALAERTLAGKDLSAGVRRSIVDCTDDLRRALAVRQRFA